MGDMLQFTRALAAPILASSLALAGCGQSFDQLEREGVGMIDRLSQLEPTPLSAMPDSGTARYDGTAFVGFGADGFGSTASKITLDADFAANHVSGRMHDWALDRGNRIDSRLDGELKIYAGRIDGNGMDAYATGRLDDGRQFARVNLELDGLFVGDRAQGVMGDIAGRAGYSDGDVREIEGGGFVAERR
jgi:hypothetical protein